MMVAKLQILEQETPVSDTADFALAFGRKNETALAGAGSIYLTLVRAKFSLKVDQLWEFDISTGEKDARKGMDYSQYRFPSSDLKFDRDDINER